MVWSMPIAEPVGAAAGVIGGEVATGLSKVVAEKLEIDEDAAKLLTVFVGHLVSAVATKAVVNVIAGDPIGLGINPVTSTVTSVAHAATKYMIAEENKLPAAATVPLVGKT